MKRSGIRISGIEKGVLNVQLSDILNEILNGNSLQWGIAFLDGMPNQQEKCMLKEIRYKVQSTDNVLRVEWEELICLDSQFDQIYETTILGSKDDRSIHRYSDDQEMYESCDIVIDLIDCAFWQVFSVYPDLLKRLKNKIKKTETLESDCRK